MTTAAGREGAGRVLDAYRTRARALSRSGPAAPDELLDELLDAGGAVRGASSALAATLDLLGADGIRKRGRQAVRLLEDDGVTYGGGEGTGDGEPGRWRLDPLPVILPAREWASVAAGVAQRAALLDLLLADLYGPREVLAQGLVPPEVVYGHSGYLRQCVGLRLPGRHQLPLTATDLVRVGGGWRALGDRTQAPSGVGYAMENRRVVARVLPGLYRDTLLERLRSFFHTLRAALQEVAPPSGEPPQVVILTPGQDSETSFDQAFLATLLGFPLVEGQDLFVRDGRLWMRSFGRPQPVDVLVRRVDSWFCDPLELRPDSRLGVPGLLEVARLGNVAIVNPPGAGVLENPGLVPFLPGLARALLGEELALPGVATWWCGNRTDRAHVSAHLDELVVRPIARGIGRANIFGWELTAAARAALIRRIEAEPHAWCGQEPLAMSTAPVVTPAGLEPRRLVLRSFAVARDDGYQVMTGALGRVGAHAASLDVSSAGGALAKDVWVIADRDDAPPGRTPREPEFEVATRVPPPRAQTLSGRDAEDLFWLGRYAERAEDAARLLRVAVDLTGDHAQGPGTPGAHALAVVLRTVTGVFGTAPVFTGPAAGARRARPFAELVRLTAAPLAPGTLAHAVRHTVDAAQGVRESLSSDTLFVLGSLERQLLELGGRNDDSGVDLQLVLSRVLEGLLALSGLAVESMVRDSGWYLMDAGRRLERALQVVALLRHALAERHVAAVEDQVLEAVLTAAESVITHRRRHPGRPRVDDVLRLLLLDPDNPRGVVHQLDRVADDLGRLPATSSAPREALLAVQARLREADPVALAAAAVAGPGAPKPRVVLASFMTSLGAELRSLADAVAAAHFARHVPPQPLPLTPVVDVR